MIFAVHKQTKEHRHYEPGSYAGNDWWYVEADPDGWIEHDGGECPLPDDARAKVRTLNGVECPLPIYAGNQRWTHGGGQYDIVAYRPILDTKPEPTAWDGDGLPPVGARVEVEDGCKGTVLAAASLKRQGSRAWLELDDGDQRIPRVECIRPIRSAEEKAIEAMRRAILDSDRATPAYSGPEAIYHAIRDGKIPGVKLEDS